MPLIIIGECGRGEVVGEKLMFCFGHIEFETPMGHPIQNI